jgi:hypothetical protein
MPLPIVFRRFSPMLLMPPFSYAEVSDYCAVSIVFALFSGYSIRFSRRLDFSPLILFRFHYFDASLISPYYYCFSPRALRAARRRCTAAYARRAMMFMAARRRDVVYAARYARRAVCRHDIPTPRCRAARCRVNASRATYVATRTMLLTPRRVYVATPPRALRHALGVA